MVRARLQAIRGIESSSSISPNNNLEIKISSAESVISALNNDIGVNSFYCSIFSDQ